MRSSAESPEIKEAINAALLTLNHPDKNCLYSGKAQQHWKMMSPMLLSFKWQKLFQNFGQRCPNVF